MSITCRKIQIALQSNDTSYTQLSFNTFPCSLGIIMVLIKKYTRLTLGISAETSCRLSQYTRTNMDRASHSLQRDHTSLQTTVGVLDQHVSGCSSIGNTAQYLM